MTPALVLGSSSTRGVNFDFARSTRLAANGSERETGASLCNRTDIDAVRARGVLG
jgi:hypothetical protein